MRKDELQSLLTRFKNAHLVVVSSVSVCLLWHSGFSHDGRISTRQRQRRHPPIIKKINYLSVYCADSAELRCNANMDHSQIKTCFYVEFRTDQGEFIHMSSNRDAV